MIDLTHYWWPIAPQSALRPGKLLARKLHGRPIVLFIDEAGAVAALQDRCPHRHAPLSGGRVCQGQLRCPYHGWQFDAQGRCTQVPGLIEFQPSLQALVPSVATQCAHGLIWAHMAPQGVTPIIVPPTVADGVDAFILADTVRCRIADAAENLLDGSHTHFIHAGWIRRDAQRQTVRVKIERIPNGIQARYTEEGLQSGIISTFLEGSRTESFGRFRLPGLAEIEYRGRKGLNLLATAWFTPEDEGQLRVHVRVATRQGWVPTSIKQAVLRRLFGLILKQDKTILEAAHANAQRFAALDTAAQGLNSTLDLLGPAIAQLLDGQTLDPSVERNVTCRL